MVEATILCDICACYTECYVMQNMPWGQKGIDCPAMEQSDWYNNYIKVIYVL